MMPPFPWQKLGIDHSQLIRVKARGFGKNWRARVSEKMVADRMARWRGSETIGRENVWKF